jgi:Flagellin and related hook-associated proteins
MIINHNLSSLYAYNKFKNNTTSVSTSMKKLSSGLRITQASDDAAGLSISEKMRAQIRGLDQAARNSQDAISMINTAEGALIETQSILQRMRELAVNAANDTYTTEDRDEIQKEINQLTSEINRIGNTTEFNTQKLLTGGVSDSNYNSFAMSTIAQGANQGSISGLSAVNGNFNITEVTASFAGTAPSWFSDVQGAPFGAGSSSITFQGVTVNIIFDGASPVLGTLSGVTDNSATLSISTGATNIQAASAIGDAFESIKAFGGASSPIADFNFWNGANRLYIGSIAKTDAYNGDGISYSSGTSSFWMNSGTTPATAGVDEVRGQYEFTIDQAIEAVGATVTIGGQVFTAVASGAAGSQFNIGNDALAQAGSLTAAINANAALNGHYLATTNGSKIILTEKINQADGVGIGATGALAGNNLTAGQYSFTLDSPLPTDGGGQFTIDGIALRVTDNANDAELADGTAVLYSSSISSQAANLAQAIAAHATLGARYTAASLNETITLTQKAGYESFIAPTAESDNTSIGFEANFQVGANTGQSISIQINDMRSRALNVSGSIAGQNISASDGALAQFKAVKEVSNGTNNTGVEYALDISTHVKAAAAISVFDDAIKSVSSERSKLGAYTNRLEHTITNLELTAENTQAAESRIRDLDMAREVMLYQKDNILCQAAQAMLAQANQQPQRVLQLLQ